MPNKVITVYLREQDIPKDIEIIRTLHEIEAAVKNDIDVITTTQTFAVSSENILKGYKIKVVMLDGEHVEIKLGNENKYTCKEIRVAHNLERMLLSNAFGYAREILSLDRL